MTARYDGPAAPAGAEQVPPEQTQRVAQDQPVAADRTQMADAPTERPPAPPAPAAPPVGSPASAQGSGPPSPPSPPSPPGSPPGYGPPGSPPAPAPAYGPGSPATQPGDQVSEQGRPGPFPPTLTTRQVRQGPPRSSSTGSFPTVGAPPQGRPPGAQPVPPPPPAHTTQSMPPPGAHAHTQAGLSVGPPSGQAGGRPPVVRPVTPAPGPPPMPPTPKRRGRGLMVVLTALVVLLLLVVTVQGFALMNISNTMDEQAQENEERVDGLENQTRSLEERTRGILNATEVSKRVLPSVFQVSAAGATGTAFAFDPKAGPNASLFLTNHHVVEAALTAGDRNVTLQREGQTVRAQITEFDVSKDLAVLQADTKLPGLQPSRGQIQPGDPVIVVGSPLGLSDTVTTGVVSAIRGDVAGLPDKVIQFDAAINPGNSGGPVINADGEVVGVAVAKARDADGIGLAIPIDEACNGLIKC